MASGVALGVTREVMLPTIVATPRIRGPLHLLQRATHAEVAIARLMAVRALHGTPPTALQGHVAAAAESSVAPSTSRQTKHARYLAKLRLGVRQLATLTRGQAASALRVKLLLADAESAGVTLESSSEEERAKLELWQQGDVSMHTAAAVEARVKLRFDARVLQVLQLMWETARRCAGDKIPDGHTATLNYDAYSALMRRVYRVFIRAYDAADADEEIAHDWRRDAKGGHSLERYGLMDAIFELADMYARRSLTLTLTLTLTLEPPNMYAHRSRPVQP